MNLLHLFVPHHRNNYRAKILHHTSLFVLIFAFTILSAASVVVSRTYPEVLGVSYQISDQELLNLVNFERTQKGLSELRLNSQLSNAASEKALHMFKNNYWAHFAPDGTTPWFFIKDQGYDYVYAGENLARGYRTSFDAVKAWMNSPTHRENILSNKYVDVGFAIKEGKLQGEDTVLIVQMFGSTTNAVISNRLPTLDQKGVSIKNTNVDVKNKIGNEIKTSPLIDMSTLPKTIVFALLSILVSALIIDLVIVEKNKIPRMVGNNLDHIILISLFMLFLFMSKIGNIL